MAVALAFPPCLPLAPQSSHPLTQTRFNFFQRILTLNPTCALIYSACYFCPALACTVDLIISSDSQGCMSLFQWEQTAKDTESLCQHHTIPHHILPKKTGAQKQGGEDRRERRCDFVTAESELLFTESNEFCCRTGESFLITKQRHVGGGGCELSSSGCEWSCELPGNCCPYWWHQYQHHHRRLAQDQLLWQGSGVSASLPQ